MVSPSPVWPAAVSTRSAGVLAAPAREATVLGAFRQGLYLRTPEGTVLPVVACDGVRLPTALWLPRRAPLAWGVQPGHSVLVGDGQVVLPGLVLRAARTWTPERVPTGVPDPTPVAPPGGPASSRAAARGLTTAVVTGLPLDLAVASVVGAGPGLTPSGDDLLCGVLLALRLAGRVDDLARLWAAVSPLLAATTSLSAALLAEAAEGYAAPPVVRLASALAEEVPAVGDTSAVGDTPGADRPPVEALVAEVLAIGHSSGAELLAGLAGTLEAVSAHAVGRPPRAGEGDRGAVTLMRPAGQCHSVGNTSLPSPPAGAPVAAVGEAG